MSVAVETDRVSYKPALDCVLAGIQPACANPKVVPVKPYGPEARSIDDSGTSGIGNEMANLLLAAHPEPPDNALPTPAPRDTTTACQSSPR